MVCFNKCSNVYINNFILCRFRKIIDLDISNTFYTNINTIILMETAEKEKWTLPNKWQLGESLPNDCLES